MPPRAEFFHCHRVVRTPFIGALGGAVGFVFITRTTAAKKKNLANRQLFANQKTLFEVVKPLAIILAKRICCAISAEENVVSSTRTQLPHSLLNLRRRGRP